MTRTEAARFLAAHAGERICVAYRTDARGEIRTRPDPRPIGVALAALGLAACTGYAPEIEHPDERCRDAHGYEVDCNGPTREDVLVVPDTELPPPPPVEPVEPVEPVRADVPIPDDEPVLVGMVAPDPVDGVDPVPVKPSVHELEGEMDLAGDIMVDEDFARRVVKDDRRAKRAARREARRERRAARG
jgi:hypothetical protein